MGAELRGDSCVELGPDGPPHEQARMVTRLRASKAVSLSMRFIYHGSWRVSLRPTAGSRAKCPTGAQLNTTTAVLYFSFTSRAGNAERVGTIR